MTTHSEEHSEHTPHILSVGAYLAVWAALMVLLVITVAVSFLNLGLLGKVVAITIAAIKAGLIVTYFMHLRYSQSLVWVFAGLGFIWFIIMFSIMISDYLARGGIIPFR
jgi:cytochrome c oxidase subunit 4